MHRGHISTHSEQVTQGLTLGGIIRRSVLHKGGEMVLKGLKSQKDIYITHKPGGHMLGYSWEDHVYLELSIS